ncbi:N-alpha-acetyltransferase 25, NatB auxiliary subunit [Holothuria leucospilota]|uniref:N-alpha-acetyltransferase 25, NatB auxiliary subunit n=1 Tax=Holothuria leucospilota TaxID=206669 RepID=A0A9Q1CDB0_HOLLE|nr:N-alpha-acetyltransferase 25, NatB auxiliary subunit [Holothuria leucospilota]
MHGIMASHSNEDAVNERRLKPIYENLDNGSYKAAMQQADKLLKKHKDLHCAKVLKALALLRMYRTEESEVLARSVVALKPTDEPTLQALSICFREMNKVELIVEIFSNAVKAQPTEEYLTHLFMALVRVEDFKRQQQTAMSLYKLTPKNPFYFWAVVSIVMQALTTDTTASNLGQKMLLPLAERMVEKMVNEEKIEAESEVNLYLMILDYQGKHEKALEVIQSPLGKSLLVSEIPSWEERVAELYFKMQKWDKANQAYRKMLLKSPDSWLYYTNLLTSGFKLQENGWKLCKEESNEVATEMENNIMEKEESVGQPDQVLSQMTSFILERVAKEEEKVQSKECKERPLRGPYLAQLEVLSRLADDEKLDNYPEAGNVLDCLIHYFELFADKTCCYSDVAPYLNKLEEDKRKLFLEKMEQDVGLISTDGGIIYATTVKQLQRHLTCLKIVRYYGFHDSLSCPDKSSLSRELVLRYKDGLKFGTELLHTDLQYSDEYLLMAIHILLDIMEETGDDSLIWQSLVLLELGHKNSRSSHHFKLLLMRLYCIAGVFGPVPDLYEGLDIKHMQQDTLGYNALKFAKSLGQLSSAATLYNTTLRFYLSGQREVMEYMIASYRFGTYQKIPEFLRFSKKIKFSLHFNQAAVEKKLLDVLLESEKEGKTFTEYVRNMELEPEKDTVEWDQLTDQRDLDVMVSWNPSSRQLSSANRQTSMKQELAWLRIRNLLLRMMAVTIELQPPTPSAGPLEAQTNDQHDGTNNKEHCNSKEVLNSLLAEFEEHLEACDGDEDTRKKLPFHGPPSPLTGEYLDGKHGKLMSLSCHVVKEAYEINEGGADDSLSTLQDSFCVHCEKLKNTLQESLRRSRRGLIKEEGDRRVFDRQVLVELSLLSETIVFVIYFMGLACRNLASLKHKVSKRNKKKKNAPKPLPPCVGKLQSTLADITQILEGLQAAVSDLEASSQSLDFTQLTLINKHEEDEEFTETEAVMWKAISGSYQESSKELLELLKTKQQCLSKLRL